MRIGRLRRWRPIWKKYFLRTVSTRTKMHAHPACIGTACVHAYRPTRRVRGHGWTTCLLRGDGGGARGRTGWLPPGRGSGQRREHHRYPWEYSVWPQGPRKTHADPWKRWRPGVFSDEAVGPARPSGYRMTFDSRVSPVGTHVTSSVLGTCPVRRSCRLRCSTP